MQKKHSQISFRVIMSMTITLMTCMLQAQDNTEIVHAEKKSAVSKIVFEKNYNKNFTANYDLKYHMMEWEVNPSVLYIQGSISSMFEVGDEDMTEMYFDLSSTMTVTSVLYEGNETSFSQSSGHLIINFDDPLLANQLYEIVVHYQGIPNEDHLITNTHNGEPGMYTFSEPFGAMEWWPCKQDLDDKVDSIDVFVTVPANLRVASNGLLVSINGEGALETHHWKHRHPIPAYLVAFAVTNYETFSVFVPHDLGEIEILNYVFPESMDQAELQSDVMAESMSFLNEKFGLYPFHDEKYGHAQWGRGGGMEHTTMSFMKHFGTSLVVHEMAHQWFGDQVTCGAWEDIWLNEGFATYCEGLYFERQHELDEENIDWYSWRISTINNITSDPDGSVHVDDVTNVSRIFNGRLTYRKGAYLLHMIRLELGEENFFQAIVNYLADPDLAYSYVRTSDLQSHLENVHGEPLDEFFNDWFYGEGYPSHYVQYVQENEQLIVKINQYQSNTSVSFFEMNLPIRILGDGGQVLEEILDYQFEGQLFEIPIDFEVTNVLFDPELWNVTGVNTVEENPLLTGDDLSFGVFPNPSSDNLTLRLNRIIGTEFSLEIYDAVGRRVFSDESYLGQNIQLDISQFPNGNYKVVLLSDEISIQKPFVVIRQ